MSDDDLEEFGLNGVTPSEVPAVADTPASASDDGWNDVLGVLGTAGDPAADILGALTRQSSAFKAFVAKRAAASRPMIRQVTPTKTRNWSIGFGPTAIPPNTTRHVTSQPGCLFRGEKIINTGDTNGLFVKGLWVGQKSQLPTFQKPIAAAAFTNTFGSDVLLDTCEQARAMTFEIENVTSATLTWSCSVFGRAVL